MTSREMLILSRVSLGIDGGFDWIECNAHSWPSQGRQRLFSLLMPLSSKMPWSVPRIACRLLLCAGYLCVFFASHAEAEYRIAVVNIEKVLNESSAGKKSRSGLDEKADDLRRQVQEKRVVLQKQEQTLKDQKIPTDSAESKKFREQVKEFNRFVSDSEEDLRQQFAQTNNALTGQVLKIIHQVAEENELAIVLDSSERSRGGVLFRQEQLDITSDVMERFP